MSLLSRDVTSLGNSYSYILGCTIIKTSPSLVVQGDTSRMYKLYNFLFESYRETIILHATKATT